MRRGTGNGTRPSDGREVAHITVAVVGLSPVGPASPWEFPKGCHYGRDRRRELHGLFADLFPQTADFDGFLDRMRLEA